MNSNDTDCPKSLRADGGHGWHFDGDDPYIICVWCKQRNDAITGKEIPANPVAVSGEDEELLQGIQNVFESGGATIGINSTALERFVRFIKVYAIDRQIVELEHVCCCDCDPIKVDFETNICFGGHKHRIEQLKAQKEGLQQ